MRTTTMDTDRVKQVVETWVIERVLNREFVLRDMRRFVEIMNDRTRAFIRACDEYAVPWYQNLANVAQDAATMTTKGVNLRQQGFLVPPMDRLAAARKLANDFHVQEPEFYTGVQELAINAMTLLTARARIIADGIDRTDV